MRTLATELALTGRGIEAHEGINATLEGTVDNSEDFVKRFFVDERFAGVQVKRSAGNGKSFPSLKVKVRDEIVGTGFSEEEANPRVRTAPKISPEELRAWYEEQKDFTVIDMRNNYEFASGHFKNSVEPGISSSRHLALVVDKLAPLKKKTVVTVCTGGVRCEKASGYLLKKGFKDVYQLHGGMHKYMEKFPGEDFLGTLYTFDGRIVMDFGGDREIVGECYFCKSKSERYENCARPECNRRFIRCDACAEREEKEWCSEECKCAKIILAQ